VEVPASGGRRPSRVWQNVGEHSPGAAPGSRSFNDGKYDSRGAPKGGFLNFSDTLKPFPSYPSLSLSLPPFLLPPPWPTDQFAIDRGVKKTVIKNEGAKVFSAPLA